MNLTIDELLNQLKTIEQQSPKSTLVIYEPDEEQEKFYHDLCQFYLNSSQMQRDQIRGAVRDLEAVLNCILGYIYVIARYIRETKRKEWLQIGLAVASIRGDGPDYRDFLLGLTELYVAALEAGMEPKDEFTKIGGGVPADFHTFAVLKRRLADEKKL